MNDTNIFMIPGLSGCMVPSYAKQGAYETKKSMSPEYKAFIDTKEELQDQITKAIKEYVIPKEIFEINKKLPLSIEYISKIPTVELFPSISPDTKVMCKKGGKESYVIVNNNLNIEFTEPMPFRSYSELSNEIKRTLITDLPDVYADLEALAMKMTELHQKSEIFMADKVSRFRTAFRDFYPDCHNFGDIFRKDPEVYILLVQGQATNIKSKLPCLDINRILREYDSEDRVWRDIENILKL